MADKKPANKSKEPSEVIFDSALESVGLPAREEGEGLEDYAGRKDWGPNTKPNLDRALEAAAVMDRPGTVAALTSARKHHDNPNPPDAHPLKR